MDAERWRRVDALLQSALQLAPAAHESFLQQACGDDEALAQEVRSLLAAHRDAGGFLDRPAMDLAATALDADDVHDIRPNQVISHYRVLRPLGRGGMGVVYEAEDTRLGRHVALKLMLDPDRGDRKALSRFHQEAQGISSLNHPNICTIHEVEEHDGTPVIVMELLDGETLKQRLARGPVPLADQIRWGMEIAEALEAAHAKGVVHRDIKPANLFITTRGSIKVLDFGLAKLVAHAATSPEDTLTSAGVLTGTTAYMSPEQVRGDAVDGRTDIWSLGVVLYEMATGARPFEEKNVALTLNAILNDQPASVSGRHPDAPGGLGRIIGKTLEKDRDRRYQHASELRADLQRAGNDAPAAADRTGSWRTRRRTVALVAGAVTVAAIFIGLNGWRRPATPAPAPLTDQDAIVVADFENHTADAVFDNVLRPALIFQLQDSALVKVLDAAQVREAMKLSGRAPDARITREIARDICLREGRKATLQGSVASLGSSYVLALEAANCQSGATIAQQQVTAADKEHVIEALARAAAGIRARLGESLSTMLTDDRVVARRVTTRSLEALQAFYMGDDAMYRGGGELAAIPFYRRAVELDPEFALAWSLLGARSMAVHEPTGKEYLSRAYALSSHISERERLYITAQYELMVTGNMDKGTEAYELLTRLYARDSVFHGNLAMRYQARGRFEDALTESEAEIRISPRSRRGYEFASDALIEMNRIDEAKAVAARAQANGAKAAELPLHALRIALAENDAPSRDRNVARLAGTPFEAIAVLYRANDLAAVGRSAAATELYERATAIVRARKPGWSPEQFLEEQAITAALFGECTRLPRQKLPLTRTVRTLCGPLETIWKFVDELPNDAVIGVGRARWTTVSADGPEAYLRGQALLGRGRPTEAAAVFEDMLRRKVANWGPEYAAAYVGLARARKQAGDVDGAKEAYDALFTLWKDADPGIPLLVSARKEYARLR